jgi:hypothetical protein
MPMAERPTRGKAERREAREARLAAALRANLRRRKAAPAAIATGPSAPPEGGGEAAADDVRTLEADATARMPGENDRGG